MTENRICKLLRIRYPLLMGGMLWVGTTKLVAAVSNAGGLGMISASNMPIQDLKREIHLARSWTSHPFGVNVPIANPLSVEQLDYLREEPIHIIVTSAGSPSRNTQRLKDSAKTVLHVVSTVDEARKAEDSGVDAVIVEGVEAGGHIGKFEIGVVALIPQVVDRVKIPVVAAGGICDVRGFLACLALGADGVQMGTRFIASEECEVDGNYKNAIITARDTDTVIVGRKIGRRRLLNTSYAQMVQEAEIRGASTEELKTLMHRDRAKLAIQGDLENGAFYAGQGVGLVEKLLSVEEIFHSIFDPLESHANQLHTKISF